MPTKKCVTQIFHPAYGSAMHFLCTHNDILVKILKIIKSPVCHIRHRHTKSNYVDVLKRMSLAAAEPRWWQWCCYDTSAVVVATCHHQQPGMKEERRHAPAVGQPQDMMVCLGSSQFWFSSALWNYTIICWCWNCACMLKVISTVDLIKNNLAKNLCCCSSHADSCCIINNLTLIILYI